MNRQRLESNVRQIATAKAKADKLRQLLEAAEQEISALEAKGKEIESGIIQGLMLTHKVSLEDVEQLMHNTFYKPKEPIPIKEPTKEPSPKEPLEPPAKSTKGLGN